MSKLTFEPIAEGGLDILCLGAHCDDIEIGCGATLLKLIEQGRVNSIRWIVLPLTNCEKRKP